MPRRLLPRPFLFLNMAMTADGKIATANRAVSTFGSARDHRRLLELRAGADAVMAGARTIDLAPITLGSGGPRFQKLRLRQGRAAQPIRVIVSGSGSVDPAAEVFRHRFSPIVILTSARAPESKRTRLASLADEVKVCGEDQIDFQKALPWLRERWGVRRLLCEGGGGLNSVLFAENLVDELNLTLCPFVFGGRTSPTIADGAGVASLQAAARFQLHGVRRRGSELFLVYRALARG